MAMVFDQVGAEREWRAATRGFGGSLVAVGNYDTGSSTGGKGSNCVIRDILSWADATGAPPCDTWAIAWRSGLLVLQRRDNSAGARDPRPWRRKLSVVLVEEPGNTG